ncbi:restriction endonuclease subunit S [Escherichia albertii]|nr:restriction endonuclease subunit S [Escherichia albertii]MCZ9117321.1 restriction endonuclease subunit S [Escherichia albertii]MCZ9197909.1 restriction endonuclease subunit S [Escherichia albertii]MCZ9216434.1 restriction endonuclease subunit S [Escherichia albertii]MCZ9223220.1 restriction endonuclease subunit S [Escherichia albertii]
MSDHMFQIPEPWEISKLPEIADINMGQSPSSSDVNEHGEGIVFFQGKAEFGKLYPTPKKYCTKPTKIASAGDILLSVRAPVGPTNLANQSTAIGRGLAAISAYHGLMESRYLLYFFRCIEPWLSTQGTGSTFKAISGQFIRDLQSPVPPLAEQKVIAEKLDTLLAQVESTKARLEQIPQILKRFRQAVLGVAVNGKLTEKWRNFEPQHSVFKKLNFESILTELRNGLSSKPNESGVGHPILRISSVRAGHVDQNDIRFLECSESELNRHKLQDGDLLFTRYNGSLEFVGVCGLLKKLQHQNLLYPDKLIRARLTKDALPEYIEIFFSSPSARNAMMNCVKTTSGQKGISGKDIKSQVVLLPPVKEQAEIVRRVEQLFAYADTIEKQVNNALARVNNLTQSILAKAFRGELTAQWRAENPELISGENSAAALLEKIKAERAASGGKKASRKKS